jgi:hypothetical protein
MARVQTIKKSNVQVEDQSPKDIQRADIIPTVGFALVVDGIFKKEFETDAAAEKAAKELLTKYPMLRVETYDASSKVRTLVR